MAPALRISIPTASTVAPADGKQYTAYHVVLHLPLRKQETKKRYTDFVQLNQDLTQQTGQAPPAALPPKSWIRRTVNNAALTEERRASLERYLGAIIEADDGRWRSSSAWRAFLNLPSGTNTLDSTGSLSTASPSSTSTSTSGAGITDPNRWLDVQRDLKSQIQSARQLLKQREAAGTAHQQHTLSADAKTSLVRAASMIEQLEGGLKALSRTGKGEESGWSGRQELGEGEIRRRRDVLVAAKKEVEGLEGVLRSMATSRANSSAPATGAAASAGDKEALLRGGSAAKPSGRVLGGPAKETERTRELDNAGVVQLQQQIMQEQDEDVMTLGKTVSRLKDMGIMINEELAIQNEMLGLVEQDVDRVQGKIDVGRRRIQKIK